MKHSLDRADGVALVAIYFILLKLALVVALALLFSCYTTPLLAILFTRGLYVAGLFVKEMRGLHSDDDGAGGAKRSCAGCRIAAEFRELRCDGVGGARARTFRER